MTNLETMIIGGEWRCPKCKKRNAGGLHKCTKCGFDRRK